MPSSQNSASGNDAAPRSALKFLILLLRRPDEAFALFVKPRALKNCLTLYVASLFLSAAFQGQLSPGPETQPLLQTTYLYRLSVGTGWGSFFTLSWFSFLTLLSTAAELPSALFALACAALPALLGILAFVAGPETAAGAACGLTAGWLFFASRPAMKFPMKAPLCLMAALTALSPLAEAAGSLSDAFGCKWCSLAIVLAFSVWILYLLIKGLRKIYGIAAPKALVLTLLSLIAAYVALFSIYKAGFMSQAALEVLGSGF